jgi:hypothetical protein
MELIRVASYADLERMCKELPYNPTSGLRGIRYGLADIADAVVAYDNWTDNAVFIHCWSSSTRPWFDVKFLTEIFRYPFEICNKGLVIGCTQGDNTPVLEFCRQVGFTETYRVKDGWKLGTDLVIQEMRREQCRWLGRDQVDEQVSTQSS